MDVIGGACEPVGRRTTSTRDPPGIGELLYSTQDTTVRIQTYIYIYIYTHTYIYIYIYMYWQKFARSPLCGRVNSLLLGSRAVQWSWSEVPASPWAAGPPPLETTCDRWFFYNQDSSLYTNIFIYLFVDNISPGLQSLGVLNHVCLGLEPSNGRDRRCLRARGPQDHLHSRPPGTDEHIISKTHLYIYIYIYIYIYMDNSSPGL